MPGGAKDSGEEAEGCSDSAVSDSEPGVSTLGCFDVVLKIPNRDFKKTMTATASGRLLNKRFH